VTVVLLTVLGMLIGGLLPWIGLAPIVGILLPLAAATGFLRREGLGWRDLGFGRPMPLGRCLLGALLGLLAIYLVTGLLVTPLLRAAGAPPLDMSLLVGIIEGDLVNYLWFLLPVSWGSAAIGEELLARGFLLNRFERVHGTSVAIVLQAVLFSAGHFYQGVTGMANILVVALVLGVVYVRLGRNLWPVILAHGAIDTVGITAVYLGYADQLTGG
jgi:membrane protease YdiL (CAAX protease family)